MIQLLVRFLRWKPLRLAFIAPLIILTTSQGIIRPPGAASLEFRVRLSQGAYDTIAGMGLQTPINGRLFIIVTQDDSSEPRTQIDVTGVPFWGMDVFDFTPSTKFISLNDRQEGLLGFPLARLSDLPEGEYTVQAFLTVYTKYQRSDGYTLLMHHETGEGQRQFRSPGNAYSQPMKVNVGKKWGKITIDLTEVIPPIQPLLPGEVLDQGNPRDTEWVKFVKIRSDAVSAFWGRDMYVGANILLPKGYNENPETYYPVIYLQGHFPGANAPFGFRPGNAFYNYWVSDEAPRFIAITFRDATPFYDTSYGVDSANVGPYGQAIVNELIPYLETNYRIIREPWARIVAGGSTGGWEALAMKVFWPNFFGGTWAWCPDGIDFNYHQIVNVYNDENAYFINYDWNSVERPSARGSDGNIDYTMKMENDWERAMGTNDRSGGQWDIWEAVYSPVGPDGYPAPVWDPVTGAMDPAVAEYWRQNFDLNYRMQQNWATLQPYLDGELVVTVGMMDTYHLEEAVYLFDEFVQTADPPADIQFDYGFRRPHCWRGESLTNPGQQMPYEEFIQVAYDWVEANRP